VGQVVLFRMRFIGGKRHRRAGSPERGTTGTGAAAAAAAAAATATHAALQGKRGWQGSGFMGPFIYSVEAAGLKLAWRKKRSIYQKRNTKGKSYTLMPDLRSSWVFMAQKRSVQCQFSQWKTKNSPTDKETVSISKKVNKDIKSYHDGP
jgi:hypothetical protein